MTHMKKILTIALALASICAAAQNNGGITPEMLTEIQKGYEGGTADKAIRNALNTTAIGVLATNAENTAMIGTDFTDKVATKGITDQKQSGRCWLFTGLNVLRAAAIQKYDLGEFQFSQNYCFFYDQLEKANLFLQAVIDTRDKPIDDREVDWLFAHPISDGGTFTGVANLVTKYGLVPADVIGNSSARTDSSSARLLPTSRRGNSPSTSSHRRPLCSRRSTACSASASESLPPNSSGRERPSLPCSSTRTSSDMTSSTTT